MKKTYSHPVLNIIVMEREMRTMSHIMCEYCFDLLSNCHCLTCHSCGKLMVTSKDCKECGNCSDCCCCEKTVFNVFRPEIHYTMLEVTAKNPEEALELAKEGNESENVEITDIFEFSHIRDVGWRVEDSEGTILID